MNETTLILPIVLSALFAGAAFYINIVEQPARLALSDGSLLAEWVPAYRRGTVMQSSLAVFGGLAGLAAWWIDPHWLRLAGAVLILANWPFTFAAIYPVTRRLTALSGPDAGTRGDIVRWGELHAVRTGLGFASLACFTAAAA